MNAHAATAPGGGPGAVASLPLRGSGAGQLARKGGTDPVADPAVDLTLDAGSHEVRREDQRTELRRGQDGDSDRSLGDDGRRRRHPAQRDELAEVLADAERPDLTTVAVAPSPIPR